MRRSALVLGIAALAACGSDHAGMPTPQPTPPPVATRAFVHVLSHTTESLQPLLLHPVLTTFAVDPVSGVPTPAAEPPVSFAPATWPGTLTADPLGRFVYVAPGSWRSLVGPGFQWGGVRSYRVDPVTGALALAGEVPQVQAVVGRLAATPTRLHLGGYGFSIAHRWPDLRTFEVDASGALTAGFSIIGGMDENFGILAADSQSNVFYFYTVDHSDDPLVVAAIPDTRRHEGYREITRLPWPGGPLSVAAAFAGQGLLVVANGSLRSYTLDLASDPPSLVLRGEVASGGGSPAAMVEGLVAAGTLPVAGYATRLTLHRVGPDGELTPQVGTADTFARLYAMAFHPSGRILYVAGTLADRTPAVELLTYLVEAGGRLRLFASMPLSPDGSSQTEQMVVTAPAP